MLFRSKNRLRFPLEVFEAMRAAWPEHKPMSVRISATDWAEGGITGDDAVEIARGLARRRSTARVMTASVPSQSSKRFAERGCIRTGFA